MKIAIVGLWHLGLVTAACLAKMGHDVTAYDAKKELIAALNQGEMPISEPHLDEYIQESVTKKHLSFTHNPADISQADIIWVTYDTPVNENDEADFNFVIQEVIQLFPVFKANSIVLISSQLPAGSTMKLQKMYSEKYPEDFAKPVSFTYSPENLRLGKAIEVFMHPERVIVGVQSEENKKLINHLFEGISNNVIFMSVPSAEMTKHALNAFLATSVVFINELASLCEQVGADASEVERGLKSEGRIGEKAYLRPGNSFAGGTLARDVTYLIEFGKQFDRPAPLFSAILESNHDHKQWANRRLKSILGNTLRGKKIAVLGLTYKPGTNTLRRSGAIEMCQRLFQEGVQVVAYDPAINELPEELETCIDLKTNVYDALLSADAAVLCTEWPEFCEIQAEEFVKYLKEPLIFDANGFLTKTLALNSASSNKNIRHFTVGKIA